MSATVARRKKPRTRHTVAIGKFLVRDPRICHGELTFRGTRVPVETVLIRLGKGRSVESILESWPELKRDAIEEAVTIAAALLLNHDRRSRVKRR
jgi:uncharacterized protein (DUF433 family)